MLLALVLYFLVICADIIWQKRRVDEDIKNFTKKYLQTWHLFGLALILGSLWVYMQQIITGKTIWPYHFVQYTIPLAMVVFSSTLFNVIKPRAKYLWYFMVCIVIFSSLLYGIYVQASVYNMFYHDSRNVQSYVSIFDWLNEKEKDCVVLVINETSEGGYNLAGLVPAFTHCNTYNSNWVFSLMLNPIYA